MEKFLKIRNFIFSAVFFAAILFGFFGNGRAVAHADTGVKYVENHVLGQHILTVVDETTDLNVTLTPDTDETYNPSDRFWSGIASVVAAGDNVFVAWRTGGQREPSPYVYVVVGISTDGGRTFREPYLIIDPTHPDGFVDVPMFYYNNAGELWLTYRVFGYTGSGEYAIKIVNPDGAVENIKYEEPIIIGNPNNDIMGCFVPYAKPLLLGNGRILFGSSNYDDKNKQSTAVFESFDDGRSFHSLTSIPSEADKNKTNGESSMVKLSDGTLWCLSRIESGYMGGIEESFSYDNGATWTNAKGNLPDPLIGPGSRFTMINLKSGGLLFVTCYNTSVRSNMTAFLSYDDGVSWPYSLTIDSHLSAYPDAYQAPDGKIYIVYDKGRYTEGGIRLSVLTEDDIIAGKVSENSLDKIVVSKADYEWADIVSVNGAFESSITVKKGTKLKKITDNLPTVFTVTDSNNKSVRIEGVWSANNYNAGQEGVYKVSFQSVLPDKLVDTFDRLQIEVTVEGGNGCGGAINGELFAVLIPVLLAGLFVALKVNNENKN